MAPVEADEVVEYLKANATEILRNVTAQAQAKKPGSPEWTESLNANSVQLIAMLVSDAGIAADQPQWWNGSPLGCLLIGVQPRGGWQILQRSVQWGQDGWAASFGVSCPSNILYQYFSCSIRNRIEVWNSDYFYSPTVPHEPINTADDSSSLLSSATTSTVSIPLAAAHRRGSEPIPLPRSHSLSIKKSPTVRVTPVRASTDLSIRSHPSHKKTPPKIGLWHHFMVDGTREFDMFRPSKLVDGSRGGNGFMCELLCPKDGATYTIDEQAYMQYLSVVLVAMALVKEENLHVWDKIMRVDLQVDTKLGRVFLPLRISLALFNILTIGLAALTAYSMFRDNLFGKGLPFVVQIASFCAWAFGAVGLLMIGGNPRVEMVKTEIPEHIRFRIEDEIERAASSGFNEGREVSYSERQFIKLRFGYLHGSVFTPSARGTCMVRQDVIQEICSRRLRLKRPVSYYLSMFYYLLYLGISVALLVAGSLVATVFSQLLAVGILILTAISRGWGISGPEEWLIPSHFMREGAAYGTVLVGKMESRK